jgi:hypothetical protein
MRVIRRIEAKALRSASNRPATSSRTAAADYGCA